MTLTGANMYSGGTTVSGGTLRVNNASGSGTGTGAVNVTGGTLGGTGTISGVDHRWQRRPPCARQQSRYAVHLQQHDAFQRRRSSITTWPTSLRSVAASTTCLRLPADSRLAAPLTLNINAYQGDLANGTYKLITYTGGLNGNTSGWTIGSSNASGAHGYSFSTATPGEIQLIVAEAAPIWTGAVSANWDTGGNWQMGIEPNDSHGCRVSNADPRHWRNDLAHEWRNR